uniref:Uncharacterized protein n=1 Tax=Lepeophtheirus salmonis TaxID=72036 RepID=A0A0K2VBV1_LEPSM
MNANFSRNCLQWKSRYAAHHLQAGFVINAKVYNVDLFTNVFSYIWITIKYPSWIWQQDSERFYNINRTLDFLFFALRT